MLKNNFFDKLKLQNDFADHGHKNLKRGARNLRHTFCEGLSVSVETAIHCILKFKLNSFTLYCIILKQRFEKDVLK